MDHPRVALVPRRMITLVASVSVMTTMVAVTAVGGVTIAVVASVTAFVGRVSVIYRVVDVHEALVR